MALQGSTISMRLVAVSEMSRARSLTLEHHKNFLGTPFSRCRRIGSIDSARARKTVLTTVANEVHGDAGLDGTKPCRRFFQGVTHERIQVVSAATERSLDDAVAVVDGLAAGSSVA